MDSSFPKDPNAILDYKWDFAASTNGTGSSDWLDTANSETITSHTVTAETGLTVDSSSITDTDTSVTAWLSGGTNGEAYNVTCHFVTSAGREDDRTIIIQMTER